MSVMAPGKVLLSGAYAVLHGAPSVVMAVQRYAMADAHRTAKHAAREVLEVLTASEAPHVDASELYMDGQKLGLGSSAAVLVASLGAVHRGRGADLSSASVRATIFHDAKEAHRRAQGGGSGVDVAASVYGGVLLYHAAATQAPLRVSIPPALHWSVYWSGMSARTSDLVSAVNAWRALDPTSHDLLMGELSEVALRAAEAVQYDRPEELIRATWDAERFLMDMTTKADALIIPAPFAELSRRARADGAAFLPSGAGGGDLAIYMGPEPPSRQFSAVASGLKMQKLDLSIDESGVQSFCPDF